MNEKSNRSYVKREGQMLLTRLFILGVVGFGLFAGALLVFDAPSQPEPATGTRTAVLFMAIPAVVLSVLLLRAIGRAFGFYFRIHRPAAKMERATYGEQSFEDPAKVRARLERERQARQREQARKYKDALNQARRIPDERERAAAIARVRREMAG